MFSSGKIRVSVVLLLGAALSLAGLSIAFAQGLIILDVQRVSVASDGTQANSSSTVVTVSADGRYVAFESIASNLVSGDTNGVRDIFVHDRQTGQTTRISVASDGTQANGNSFSPALSADGRFVAFDSFANNLVSGDTNGLNDIFVHDRQTGQTTHVSVASDSTWGNSSSARPALSADGRYVAFDSFANNLVSGDTNNFQDVFVHDRQTGQTTRVSVAGDGSQGNSPSFSVAISADGRYIVFGSASNNLVSGDTNGASDIFVHDRQTGQTTRVSVALSGAQSNSPSRGPAISADGRHVAFESDASNLVGGDTNGFRDAFTVTFLDPTPTVFGVLPFNGTLGVKRSTVVNIVFSEPVSFNPAAFALACNGVPRAFTLNSSPNRVVILTPTIQLPANATCTVTAIADEITAVSDLDKMAGNFVASFSTAPPTGKLETIGIFRPSDTTFYLRNSNTTGPADFSILFGDSSDLPVAGDWNGDGIATIGIYRPSTGEFFLKDENTFGAPVVYNFTLGNPGDVPFAGDWDGDGKDSVGVYRPTNGVIFMKDTLSTGFADYAMLFGIAGDQPLAGDWNADGADSVGIYRGDEFFLTDTTCNGCIPTADYIFVLGIAGDVPFAGDWNNSGSSGVGVFRPTDGVTFFKNALSTGFADIEIVYGIAGDKPIAGVWGAPPLPEAPSAPEVAPTFVPRQ